MAKILYTPRRFNRSSMEVIDQANAIIEEYMKQGYDLTLRQLYYQFVARDLLVNTIQSYTISSLFGPAIPPTYIDILIRWGQRMTNTYSLSDKANSSFARGDLLKGGRAELLR